MKKTHATLYDMLYDTAAAERPSNDRGYRRLSPDLLLGHDPLIAMIVDAFDGNGFSLSGSLEGKILFTADHFAPPSTAERAAILRKFLDFSGRMGVKPLVYEGICHQLVAEDPRAVPFAFVAGSDSHTVMAGALGCLAAGYGSMDILHCLVKGYIAERRYPAVSLSFAGPGMSPGVTGRDLSLEMIRVFGEGGASGNTIEIADDTLSGICMDDRFAISNASIECGAYSGIFIPDAITFDYLASRDGAKKASSLASGASMSMSGIEFSYDRNHYIDVSDTRPLVAMPHDFSRIVDASDASGIPVDQVFVGSCASGRLRDMVDMCAALDAISRASRKKKIMKNSGVRLIVTPSSQKVFREAMKAGYIARLSEFGAVITNPSCGPCGGIDKGLIGPGEKCLSTSTRNFRGRMGAADSEIYIASPVTAICSAYAGMIVSPEEFFKRRWNR